MDVPNLFHFQRDPDCAAGRSVRVCVEAAGDAGGPDALQAHAAGADIHQDIAQDAATGESLDCQKAVKLKKKTTCKPYREHF